MAILFLICLAIGLLPMAWMISRRSAASGYAPTMPMTWFALAAIVPAVTFLLLFEGGPHDGGFVLFLLILMGLAGLFAWAWVREFTGLMAMSDDCFPGRHDKLVWVAMLVFLPPVGLIAFRTFRRAYWAAEKSRLDASTAELL